MPRLPRICVPNAPHHVTARGNRREPIFFEDADQDIYCDILAEQVRKARVEVWAYCLMPNHVHLILCPSDGEGLSHALGAAHKRWANFINARGRWKGPLFDRRFASVAMDEPHLIAALRYVALNPVRAGFVRMARDWKWSSVRAHLAGKDARYPSNVIPFVIREISIDGFSTFKVKWLSAVDAPLTIATDIIFTCTSSSDIQASESDKIFPLSSTPSNK